MPTFYYQLMEEQMPGWKPGSSFRVPSLQVQSPEFKPQDLQGKNKTVSQVSWLMLLISATWET
jgi:hypothetical protein